MTRIIIESDNDWTIGKISNAINAEIMLLKRSITKTESKISQFTNKYGKQADRSTLYGKADDLELIEWEGEIETLNKLREKLGSLEEIHIEHK